MSQWKGTIPWYLTALAAIPMLLTWPDPESVAEPGQTAVVSENPVTVNVPLIEDGTYWIVARHSGMVIEAPGCSMLAGTIMAMWPKNPEPSQRWRVKNLGNDVITLTNVQSNLLLEVTAGSSQRHAPVDQMPDTGADSQRWRVVPVGDGYFQLVNLMSGQALDVNSGSTNPGAQVDQFPYHPVPWEQWGFMH